jgi:uncharacterized RDD family membrane protein YckC
MPVEQSRSSLPHQRPSEAPYPVARDGRTDGVLGRRFFAYLIDLLVVLGLTLVLGFAIVILGFLTLGLAWWLFAILGPGTAILYSALTVGGPSQGTYGMRALDLRIVDAGTGGPVDLLTAAVHALLFYVAAGTFVLLVLDVLVGAVRADRRLGHDLLVGVLLVRRT